MHLNDSLLQRNNDFFHTMLAWYKKIILCVPFYAERTILIIYLN